MMPLSPHLHTHCQASGKDGGPVRVRNYSNLSKPEFQVGASHYMIWMSLMVMWVSLLDFSLTGGSSNHS